MNFFNPHLQTIQSLCESHKVKSLFAFGSVNTAQFKENSDIDLLVDFEKLNPVEYADNYFDLKFSLQDILKRNIDLLEMKALKNSFLKKEIDRSKVLVYGRD